MLNVVLSPGEPNAAREPDNVRVLPPVHVTMPGLEPETVSEPLSVTAEAPKLCIVNEYVTVPLPRVGSLFVGEFVKPKAVIFGMPETTRISLASAHVVEAFGPLIGAFGV